MAQPMPFRDRFDVDVLYSERFAVATPPGHRLSSRKTVALAEIDGENYVNRIDCEFGGTIGELMKSSGVKVRVVFESGREDWVQMMIMSGAGIACLPEYAPLLPGLRVSIIANPPVVREVSLVTLAGRRLPPATASHPPEHSTGRFEYARLTTPRRACQSAA